MSLLVSRSHRYSEPDDSFLDNPPFPLAGAAVGLVALVNVASTLVMLLSV
jgi:hypothetical protein